MFNFRKKCFRTCLWLSEIVQSSQSVGWFVGTVTISFVSENWNEFQINLHLIWIKVISSLNKRADYRFFFQIHILFPSHRITVEFFFHVISTHERKKQSTRKKRKSLHNSLITKHPSRARISDAICCAVRINVKSKNSPFKCH